MITLNSFSAFNQIAVISKNENNETTELGKYDNGFVYLNFNENTVVLSIDYDGSGKEYDRIQNDYLLDGKPNFVWTGNEYQIELKILESENNTVSIYLSRDGYNSSILIFFNDKSKIYYSGEGVMFDY